MLFFGKPKSAVIPETVTKEQLEDALLQSRLETYCVKAGVQMADLKSEDKFIEFLDKVLAKIETMEKNQKNLSNNPAGQFAQGDNPADSPEPKTINEAYLAEKKNMPNATASEIQKKVAEKYPKLYKGE